jgi:hypothetical protein
VTLTLTIASLRRHDACDLGKRVDDLRRVLPDVRDDFDTQRIEGMCSHRNGGRGAKIYPMEF